jgi:hypothetical protein
LRSRRWSTANLRGSRRRIYRPKRPSQPSRIACRSGAHQSDDAVSQARCDLPYG